MTDTSMHSNDLPGYRRYMGIAPKGTLDSIEQALEQAKGVEEIKGVLMGIEYLNVTQDHVDLIADLGREWGSKKGKDLEEYAARKLRQLYTEVLKFDLQNGTQTSGFIPETFYHSLAKEKPDQFADTKNVEHGVRHRASLTSVIRAAFNQISSILKENNLKIEDTSLYDYGCGTGKPSLIARAEYSFKNVVGIDYLESVLELGKKNREIMGFGADKKIAFKFADAALFKEFKSPIACYAYNPADAVVISQIVKNLEEANKPTVFAYNKPLHAECFKSENGWNKEVEMKSNDDDKRLTVFSRNLVLAP